MTADTAFQLGVLAAGYVLGAGLAVGGARLLGVTVDAGGTAALVLALPLVTALVAEVTTGLWRHTPGSLGLGGLSAFTPLAVAGLVAGLAVLGVSRLAPPYQQYAAREGPALTTWVATAMCCAFVALALWRWWPEPRARLW